MSCFSYVTEVNIKRFQNLLETSIDEAERQIIKSLLAEEKAKVASQTLQPEKK